jgi:helicase MOV-10
MSYCKWSSPSYRYSTFKQHNPNRSSRDFELYNGGTSLYSIKLLNNYRSHPDILKVPNQLFYQSELEPVANKIVINRFLGWEGLENKNCPILFIHTVGKDMREGNSPSFFNITEIQQTMQVVESLRSLPGISGDMIGVIAPYNKQCETLRKNLKRFGVNSVGNVETFQGQERDVIIISTVRSNPEFLAHDSRFNLGFVGDPKRFNVSVTRAKGLCIVIGNGEILCRDKSWQAWIRHAYEMNAIRGLTRDLVVAINAELSLVEEDNDDDEEEKDLLRLETGWREIE